ncbi:MAG: hypothetical protein GY866_24540 [Proteobacteria bacterium]|nr:hypothetical protein [Pseudomonadota bacterium]
MRWTIPSWLWGPISKWPKPGRTNCSKVWKSSDGRSTGRGRRCVGNPNSPRISTSPYLISIDAFRFDTILSEFVIPSGQKSKIAERQKSAELSRQSFPVFPGMTKKMSRFRLEMLQVGTVTRIYFSYPAGNVAGTYLYLDWASPGRGIVSEKERKLFEAWSGADPVDEWECRRAEAIEKVQGDGNPFVEKSCAIAGTR